MNILIDFISLIFVAFISAGLGQFLNYCFGLAGDAIGERAIFSGWIYFMARNTLKRNNPTELNLLKELFDKWQLKREVMIKGSEYFTWELALGGCTYCTNFWISELIAILLTVFNPIPLFIIPDFFWFITTPIFAHVILKRL